MNLQPPKHAQAAFTEFDITLPTILGGPGRHFPKELANSKVLAEIGQWISKTFEYGPVRCVLRRFLAGEFTGGVPPYHIPDLQRIHVEKMLRTLDVIEAMAHVADTRHRAQEAGPAEEELLSTPGVQGALAEVRHGTDWTNAPSDACPASGSAMKKLDPDMPSPNKPPKAKKGCDVLDCDRPHCAKGLCSTHYHQQRPARSRSSKGKTESPEPAVEPVLAGDEQGVT